MSCLAFLDIGFSEMLVVAFVALILFGGRLPEVMRSLGTSYRNFRRGMDDMTRQVTRPDLGIKPPAAPYRPVPPPLATLPPLLAPHPSPPAPAPTSAAATPPETVAAPPASMPSVPSEPVPTAPARPETPPTPVAPQVRVEDDTPHV